MMPTPNQNRLNPDGTVSAMIMYGTGKLKTLAVFPSIFKGEHVRHPEMGEVLTGRRIQVEFNRPTPLQIDGEPFRMSQATRWSAERPGNDLLQSGGK